MRFSFVFSGGLVLSVFLAGAGHADVSTGVELLNAGDVSGAATEFATAYDAGDADGAFYLGRLFELGLGTERDEMRAANLYAAAAEKGSARAKARLGLMYHEGRVLLRDYVEGTRLLCEAAEAGNADGQLNCGLALQAGRGVEADDARGLSYIEAAAKQGSVLALNVLGQHYLDKGDTETATRYLAQAADAGNALAMYEYARLLSSGETPDTVAAYNYASLAAVRGLPVAGQLLDQLESQMAPEDVLAAQARTREWTAKRLAETGAKTE